MVEPIHLGTVDLPTGVLVVVDPGLAHNWDRQKRHERFDLQLIGPDAEKAGRQYDRSYDPLHLYDVSDVAQATRRFAEFTREHGFASSAQVKATQLTHRQRVERSLHARESGIGCFEYTRLWGIAVSGFPKEEAIDIAGIPMEEGEFSNRFRSIDLVVGDLSSIASTKTVTGVMVDHGQLGCFDLGVMDALHARRSRDGLGDFLFWGPDAEELAHDLGAAKVSDTEFGWIDTPVSEMGRYAQPAQERAQELRVRTDYRPHCPIEMINRQVRESEARAGETKVDGLRIAAFDNRWGDGIFTVHRDEDADGELVRVRLDVGSEAMQKRMREFRKQNSR